MFSRKCVCKLDISKIVRPLLAALSVNGLMVSGCGDSKASGSGRKPCNQKLIYTKHLAADNKAKRSGEPIYLSTRESLKK